MILLSIDPGKRHCGAALWKDGELQRAALVKSPGNLGHEVTKEDLAHTALVMASHIDQWVCRHVDRVVCERPRTYGGRSKKGDALDLIDLGVIVGYLIGRLDCGAHELVLPQDWGAPGKGHLTSKKAYEAQGYVPEARARRDLSAAELALVEWGNDWKRRLDVADALGIGFWWLRTNGVRR